MSTPKDGGPAFPNEHRANGMTLRDWFAGQALAGLLANPDGRRSWGNADWADEAFDQADAMLKAREPKP